MALTNEQKDLIVMFGLEGIKFAARAWKAARARGVELDQLAAEAEKQNEKFIRDAIVSAGGTID
jgi:hypothetical protein